MSAASDTDKRVTAPSRGAGCRSGRRICEMWGGPRRFGGGDHSVFIDIKSFIMARSYGSGEASSSAMS